MVKNHKHQKQPNKITT